MGMMPPSGPPQQSESSDQAPAAQILPIMAMLAQQQQTAMQQQSQQESALKEAMRQQILRLVSMMPTENPAGMAARTEPMPTSMSPTDQSGVAPMDSGSPQTGMED